MPTISRPVALITGSATGVGRACVLQFAERGYDVIVNYCRSETEALDTAAEAGKSGGRVLTIRCDVSVDSEVQKMIAQIDQTYGRLDVLVNNAATTKFIAHEDLDAMTEELWDRILAVNLKGPFFVIRAAADLLRAGEGGSVVNISSVAGIVGNGSSVAYCASKAGLNNMTLSLARAMGPAVRVNAVCPGPINSRWLPEGKPGLDLDKLVSRYPIPKLSQPDDIADAVMFFAEGTSMTTGQLLSVDGGQALH